MGFVVKDGYGPGEQPPIGLQNAVCCGVHDLGMLPGFNNELQHKCVIIFETEAVRQAGDWAGKRFIVTKTYNATLNEKATLSKDLESWRGKAFTAEERAGFDTEVLIGKPCSLNLIEKTTKAGKVMVVIGGILPHLKNNEVLTPENPADYLPKWIRQLMAKNEEAEGPSGESTIDNEDIPF